MRVLNRVRLFPRQLGNNQKSLKSTWSQFICQNTKKSMEWLKNDWEWTEKSLESYYKVVHVFDKQHLWATPPPPRHVPSGWREWRNDRKHLQTDVPSRCLSEAGQLGFCWAMPSSLTTQRCNSGSGRMCVSDPASMQLNCVVSVDQHYVREKILIQYMIEKNGGRTGLLIPFTTPSSISYESSFFLQRRLHLSYSTVHSHGQLSRRANRLFEGKLHISLWYLDKKWHVLVLFVTSILKISLFCKTPNQKNI